MSTPKSGGNPTGSSAAGVPTPAPAPAPVKSKPGKKKTKAEEEQERLEAEAAAAAALLAAIPPSPFDRIEEVWALDGQFEKQRALVGELVSAHADRELVGAPCPSMPDGSACPQSSLVLLRL